MLAWVVLFIAAVAQLHLDKSDQKYFFDRLLQKYLWVAIKIWRHLSEAIYLYNCSTTCSKKLSLYCVIVAMRFSIAEHFDGEKEAKYLNIFRSMVQEIFYK